jgi:hypothetical protein
MTTLPPPIKRRAWMAMAMRKGVEVRRAPMARNFFFSDFFSAGAGGLGLAAGGTPQAYA